MKSTTRQTYYKMKVHSYQLYHDYCKPELESKRWGRRRSTGTSQSWGEGLRRSIIRRIMLHNSFYTQEQPIRPNLFLPSSWDSVKQLQIWAYERWGQVDTQPYNFISFTCEATKKRLTNTYKNMSSYGRTHPALTCVPFRQRCVKQDIITVLKRKQGLQTGKSLLLNI